MESGQSCRYEYKLWWCRCWRANLAKNIASRWDRKLVTWNIEVSNCLSTTKIRIGYACPEGKTRALAKKRKKRTEFCVNFDWFLFLFKRGPFFLTRSSKRSLHCGQLTIVINQLAIALNSLIIARESRSTYLEFLVDGTCTVTSQNPCVFAVIRISETNDENAMIFIQNADLKDCSF